jgi:hypothetical protein
MPKVRTKIAVKTFKGLYIIYTSLTQFYIIGTFSWNLSFCYMFQARYFKHNTINLIEILSILVSMLRKTRTNQCIKRTVSSLFLFRQRKNLGIAQREFLTLRPAKMAGLKPEAEFLDIIVTKV